MSDNILRIVPRDACFLPCEGAEKNVVRVINAMIPHYNSIKVNRHDSIVFMDCGENFKRAICPRCEADLTEEWVNWMGASFGSRFQDREFNMPCCGARIDLNDLRYELPMGFASWSAEVLNPSPATFMPDHDQALVEAALTCPIRQILARF